MPNTARQIYVTAHNPQWITRFRQEAIALQSLFGEEVAGIHHIGSTSVPDLPAKPVIDILLEVRDINAVDSFNDQMRALGYEPRGEYGLPRRRYFPKSINGERFAHVHTWESGDEEITRHICFRDFLIAHPEMREAYGRLKIKLIEQFDGDQESYITGKHDFCQATEKRAIVWQNAGRSQAIESSRLTILPLNRAELWQYLNRPSQLEASLHLTLSRDILTEPVRQAIRSKLRDTAGAMIDQLLWNTYWLVIIRTESFGAGLVGFKGAPEADGAVEIGYGIDPTVQRQGYATESVGTLVDWALAHKECRAITADTEKQNTASVRVLEKLGFTMAKERDDMYCWIVTNPTGGLIPDFDGK